jgi:transcription elongation factor
MASRRSRISGISNANQYGPDSKPMLHGGNVIVQPVVAAAAAAATTTMVAGVRSPAFVYSDESSSDKDLVLMAMHGIKSDA